MVWYQDRARKTNVVTYKNEKLMRAEVEAAAQFGFVTQAMTQHGQEWTVTYHRDERTWARIQVENALGQLSQEREKLAQAKRRIEGLQNDLQAHFRLARTETSDPTKLESRLLQTITNLISARNAANLQRQVLLNAYASMGALRAEAASLQVVVPQANINIEAESAPISAEMGPETNHLQEEQAIQQAQQRVLEEVKAWQVVVGNRWGAIEKAARAEKQVAARRTSSLNASSTPDSKVRAAETELTKRQTKLQAMEALLEQREADLLRQLEARDKVMAAALN